MSTRPRARRRTGLRLVPLVLLLVFIAEVATLIAVGRLIGVAWTILLLLGTSVLGVWLVRREGRRTWAALRETARSGEMPSRQVADALLVMVGGVLLIPPGFVTDLVGLIFVLPFTRPVARIGLEAVLVRRMIAVGGPGPAPPPGRARVERTQDDTSGEVIEGEIVEDE